MTAKRRLLSKNEISEAGDLAIKIMAEAIAKGLPVGGVDIRGDGVTLLPKAESVSRGNAFDQWKAEDAGE